MPEVSLGENETNRPTRVTEKCAWYTGIGRIEIINNNQAIAKCSLFSAVLSFLLEYRHLMGNVRSSTWI